MVLPTQAELAQIAKPKWDARAHNEMLQHHARAIMIAKNQQLRREEEEKERMQDRKEANKLLPQLEKILIEAAQRGENYVSFATSVASCGVTQILAEDLRANGYIVHFNDIYNVGLTKTIQPSCLGRLICGRKTKTKTTYRRQQRHTVWLTSPPPHNPDLSVKFVDI